MNKSVEEIIEDWREQMKSCDDPDTMVTCVMSKDILAIIKYFDDLEAFETSI